MEMNHKYASKGVAGAGLGTGIAGLSLGVLNSLGGLAGLGGLLGGRPSPVQNDAFAAMMTAEMLRNCARGSCRGDCDPVTQRELTLTQKLAEKDTQIVLRDANTFADQKNIELYRYIDGRLIEIEKQFGSQAVQNQATKDSFQLLRERLECCCSKLQTAIEAEAKERRCNDNTIVNYANQTFYPKEVAAVTTGTTVTPQSTYNPLPACSCSCGS